MLLVSMYNKMRSQSKIVQFFDGKVIFVTGATGFLGKALVNKLLSVCDGIEAIYILIRDKRGKDVERRFEEFLQDDVFDKLRSVNPNFKTKIIPLVGEISKPRLGLSEKDWNTLTERVSVIFHVAATVRFLEALKTAIQLNVRGTEEVKNLGLGCKNLASAVFVGTAFSQFPSDEVNEEKFYKPPMTAAEAIRLDEQFTKEGLERIKPSLIGNTPNTYIYTKAISEEIIRSLNGRIPCCLFKPAIITGAVQEPTPGWIAAGGAISTISILIAKGLLKVVPANTSKNTELVPVDYVANAMIVCCYKTALLGAKETRIYNYVASAQNPVKWKVWKEAHQILKKFKETKQTTFRTVGNKFYFILSVFLMHTLAALIKDFCLIITLRKPEFFKLYLVYNSVLWTVSPFGWIEQKSTNRNTQNLWRELSQNDKKLFPFDMAMVEWKSYLENHIQGIITHLLKWKIKHEQSF